MTDKQPEALQLAQELFEYVQFVPRISENEPGGYYSECDAVMDAAAAELRRLHEVNAELVKVVTYFRYMLTDPTLVGVAVRALAKAQGDNNANG